MSRAAIKVALQANLPRNLLLGLWGESLIQQPPTDILFQVDSSQGTMCCHRVWRVVQGTVSESPVASDPSPPGRDCHFETVQYRNNASIRRMLPHILGEQLIETLFSSTLFIKCFQYQIRRGLFPIFSPQYNIYVSKILANAKKNTRRSWLPVVLSVRLMSQHFPGLTQRQLDLYSPSRMQ